MSWQEVSVYWHRVHTGDRRTVTSKLNGSEIDLTQERSECERSSTT